MTIHDCENSSLSFVLHNTNFSQVTQYRCRCDEIIICPSQSHAFEHHKEKANRALWGPAVLWSCCEHEGISVPVTITRPHWATAWNLVMATGRQSTIIPPSFITPPPAPIPHRHEPARFIFQAEGRHQATIERKKTQTGRNGHRHPSGGSQLNRIVSATRASRCGGERSRAKRGR